MSIKKVFLFPLLIIVAIFILSNLAEKSPEDDAGNGNGSPTGKTLVGMIPASPDPAITLPLLTSGKAFSESAKEGAEIMYWYIEWKDLVNDWGASDFIMPKLKQGGQSAVVISVINTTTLSQYPKGYKTFTQNGFAADYAEFVGEFAGRYKPNYIFIGNEVNTYLNDHKGEVSAFQNILKSSRDAIKKASPNTKVGVSVAYRDGIPDNFSLIKKLSENIDVIGYTVYAFKDPDFQFGDPKEGIDMLKKVGKAVPGKPYAVIETGWSSSELLGSSEAEQAQFMRLLLDYIPTSDAEFINWFILQDGRDCSIPARAFLTPEMKPQGNEFEIFKEFLCKFGAKNADGSDKEAWRVWKEKL